MTRLERISAIIADYIAEDYPDHEFENWQDFLSCVYMTSAEFKQEVISTLESNAFETGEWEITLTEDGELTDEHGDIITWRKVLSSIKNSILKA